MCAQLQGLELAVPGTYIAGEPVVTIAAFVIIEFTKQQQSLGQAANVDWRLVPAGILVLFALWILAALALAHEGSKEAFIAEFSGSQRDVAMFLTHDVLARQAPQIQDFLVRTSILDRFCLGLVEAVCPGQDCAATYGAAVVIHEILTLTETDFREAPVAELRPEKSGPFPHGLHTLVHDGERFWVDGKRFVLDLGLFWKKFVGRASGLMAGTRGG